jgi:uncharacterized protein
MTTYLIICSVAFLVSILTFFSGFGLGTLLTPAFWLFFPVDVSIALTGIVHFFNNLFKLGLVGRHANRDVLLRFGIPAVAAALVGSWLLLEISDIPVLHRYQLGGHTFEITLLKVLIACLLIAFSLFDIIPALKRIQFGREKLPLGGILSGFFGGLSGHQGALRSAFLIRAGLSKEAFVGTGIVVSCFIDFTRLGVYSARIQAFDISAHAELLFAATFSAIVGAYIGNKLLKKVTITFIQYAVAALLFLVSLALGTGVI